MAIGLFGYAVWRVSSAIFDSDHRGRDAKGILIRAGGLIRGIFYAWIAIELFLGGGKSSDTQARHWTARAMDKPFGRWAVAIADYATGVTAAMCVGFALLHRARTGEGQHIDCSLIDTYFNMHEVNVPKASLRERSSARS